MILTKEYLIEHGFSYEPDSNWQFKKGSVMVTITSDDYVVALNGLKHLNGSVTVEQFEEFCQ